MQQDMIVILDLGSDRNSHLARAIRALGVYSEIHPHDITQEEFSALPRVKGIILNGGDYVATDGSPLEEPAWLAAAEVPVLNIGYTSNRPVDVAEFPESDIALNDILKPFLYTSCAAEANWNMENFANDQVELIRREVGDKQILLALSGGVDSSVVAALLIRAIGKQLHCVHVNHGLMRKDESVQVINLFSPQLGENLVYVDASVRFLTKLQNVADPEAKRKIIGEEFIRVFEEESQKLGKMDYLAQGTIYPDIVESGTKTQQVVKSHHNVGGLPDDISFSLIEPLKFLFKDEVRALGTYLGLPDPVVNRQPFPGPGLGVRCLGAITVDRLEMVREADAILREEFAQAGLDKKVWQYFTIVPDFKSVGVLNGARAMGYPVIIRAVNTIDAMTADVEPLDWPILSHITNRILAEVPGVNRVLYDMSPKPPATIEWE